MTDTRWPHPFTAGFRLFFPLAGLAALVFMLRTAAVLHGTAVPHGNPFAWHGHEMLFGYVAAAAAGFLLTAVPNWTGTQPASGTPLLGLFALWLAARIGLWSGDPAAWAVAADIAFLPAAALVAARPLWRAGNPRRWLPVGVLLLVALGNVLWHLGALVNAPALPERALAFTTFAIALLIAVIGGRIIPAFTRNRLRADGEERLPRDGDWRDPAAIAASAAVALAELALPGAVAGLALLAAALHAVRLVGWRGLRTWRDPLLFVLHVGYAWLAAGYALRGLGALLGPPWSGAWALHGLLAGAIGTMTLAVMSRATLGHTGRTLRAGPVLTLAFAAVSAAAAVRLAGPLAGVDAWRIAGGLWALAFVLFLARCGPMCFRPRVSA